MSLHIVKGTEAEERRPEEDPEVNKELLHMSNAEKADRVEHHLNEVFKILEHSSLLLESIEPEEAEEVIILWNLAASYMGGEIVNYMNKKRSAK